jgi:hypothetical protein
MRLLPILIVLHLLTIIFTSARTSGEEQRVRGRRIRLNEPIRYEEEGIKMQDNRNRRLIEIIMVKEKAKNKSTERSRKPGINQKRDNPVYKRTREEAVTHQSLDGNKRNRRRRVKKVLTTNHKVSSGSNKYLKAELTTKTPSNIEAKKIRIKLKTETKKPDISDSQSSNRISPTKGPILEVPKSQIKVATLYVADGGIFSPASIGSQDLNKLEKTTNRENIKKAHSLEF